MKEFKGTPGNWQVVDNYDDYDEYTPENPQIYIWNGDEQAHKAICDMGEMGDFNYAKDLANAKLIAAAPELLEALQHMVEFSNKWGREWFTSEQWAIIEKSKAALTKALD